jgi:hypothetical protein
MVFMKRTVALSLLLALFSTLAFAQKPAAISDVEANLRKHVEYLASDKLEGRRTGEQGATYAAEYIANIFAQYKLKGGLQSANGKPNYLQPFPYVAGVTLGPGNVLTVNGKALASGTDWMPLGYSPNADIPQTPVVFAGFGVVAPEANYDDYSGLNVRDQIVVILDSTPEAGNPHSPFARFNIHTKANIAKDKGARAIILMAEDPDFKNDRLSRLSYDRTLGETAIPVIGMSRSQATELFGAAGEDLAKKWTAAKTEGPPFAPVKISARLKVDLVKNQVNAYNVIGILEGKDPVLKNEAIIIGAHYDHLGRGGQGSLDVNSTEIHHGADDNASGTSAVLELARQFADASRNRDSSGAGKRWQNKRTIIFMSFSGEEEGLLGSNYYVNNPVWPLDKTVAMINLDMVGRLKDQKLSVGGIGTASEWRSLIDKANPTTEVVASTVTLGSQPTTTSATVSGPTKQFNLQLNEDGFGPSDHSSFYSKKVPVLFFFTGTHQDYHKPSDTFEKINYTGLSQIAYMVYGITDYLSQIPTRPTYTVAKSSGTMGRTGFNVSLGTVPNYAETSDGMLLDGVRDNSPAAKAGLKPGDKIVKLAGHDVRNAMDYTFVLGTMKAGEEYEVVLKRGDETLTLKIIPAPAARRP